MAPHLFKANKKESPDIEMFKFLTCSVVFLILINFVANLNFGLEPCPSIRNESIVSLERVPLSTVSSSTLINFSMEISSGFSFSIIGLGLFLEQEIVITDNNVIKKN